MQDSAANPKLTPLKFEWHSVAAAAFVFSLRTKQGSGSCRLGTINLALNF
jgi:hypothetical protein